MFKNSIYIISIILLISCIQPTDKITRAIESPPETAKPWVYWYWRKAAVSKEGIARDLIAMKEQGIGGAYLFTVQGAESPPLFEPVAEQLSTYWWSLIDHTFKTADSLGLKIAMHACDGFSIAGGPWITPELSMQKVVWKDTVINGGGRPGIKLPVPGSYKGYYEDIALFAYPTPTYYGVSSRIIRPAVSSSLKNTDLSFLPGPMGDERLRCDDSCWFMYTFKEAFTCRSIEIVTKGNNLQSHRLIVEASDDGIHFTRICRLKPPRNGWEDYDAPISHAIPPTTAKYFRFIFNPEGTGPGSEDYDAAKWKQTLKLHGLVLSGKAIVHQYEGKNGEVWRVGEPTTTDMLPDSLCIPSDQLVNISGYMDSTGLLSWQAPPGKWTILRIGHTSTGHTNYIGGAGLGLECDKFNPVAVKLQFDKWFGQFFEKVDQELATRVLKIFHTDSWEAGSQNWSPVFRNEFKKRRGYDLYQYLPVMTGLPVNNAELSERFLKDVRTTIEELLVDNFFAIMADQARKKGCVYSAESVAPTFVSDAMLHFKETDIPMGEFWHNSPTHDKPNDVLDAISAAHVYGKKIIQAESFTTLRMEWNEHPGMLKALLDRNFALGINRVCYHVFCQNPWMDRKPGMTLDGVGLYFQPDQTWWGQGKAWVEYATRCQSLLQLGKPVADIAVFTGEETPRRALTPDRLVNFLPGLFGQEKLDNEKRRLENEGTPYHVKPVGVTNTKNTYDPAEWIDPLSGYHYDSFNKDALLNLASVENGKIVLPGGAEYSVLVIPGSRRMAPEGKTMSVEVLQKLEDMAKQGATIIWAEFPDKTPNLLNADENDKKLLSMVTGISGYPVEQNNNLTFRKYGKGKIVEGLYHLPSLDPLGIEKDLMIVNSPGKANIAWNHRTDKEFEIYFLSNQDDTIHFFEVSLRTSGYEPELYYPVNGNLKTARQWHVQNNRTIIPVKMEARESFFIILRKKTRLSEKDAGLNYTRSIKKDTLDNLWQISFDPEYGGPTELIETHQLKSWARFENEKVMHYSGTAKYSTKFTLNRSKPPVTELYLTFEQVENLATVIVNGTACGTLWTRPYTCNISRTLNEGENTLEIYVTNTWANRIMGDEGIENEEKITQTTAPYRLKDKPLNDAGIIGNVILEHVEGF